MAHAKRVTKFYVSALLFWDERHAVHAANMHGPNPMYCWRRLGGPTSPCMLLVHVVLLAWLGADLQASRVCPVALTHILGQV